MLITLCHHISLFSCCAAAAVLVLVLMLMMLLLLLLLSVAAAAVVCLFFVDNVWFGLVFLRHDFIYCCLLSNNEQDNGGDDDDDDWLLVCFSLYFFLYLFGLSTNKSLSLYVCCVLKSKNTDCARCGFQ